MEEERVYTYSEVVARLRRRLVDYFGQLAESLVSEEPREEVVFPVEPGVCSTAGKPFFGRIGVVDGGSGVVALNVGYVGVVSAVAVVIEGNRVVDRVVADPLIVPEDPAELPFFESESQVASIVDKVREALVFETATRVAEKGVDLLVVDGPLVPYGALAKIVTASRAEERAWARYRRAVLALHERTSSGGVSVVGFVKRPRSRYIARLHGLRGFDHVVLSRVLRPGEYYPEPPLDLSMHPELFHDPDVVEIVREVVPRTTYLRLVESAPPSRVDFGRLSVDYRAILSYFYSTRTREGVPFAVMKADEEAKITRKLIRELYDDVLHEYIVKYVKNKPYMLVPLLPEYGGL